jgi:5-methylcytosine-specific restriction endonuclease McrA
MTMSKRRKRLFAEQDGVCANCNQQCVMWGQGRLFTLDHVYPRSKGGSDELDNLIGMCEGCNTRKAGQMPSERILRKLRALIASRASHSTFETPVASSAESCPASTPHAATEPHPSSPAVGQGSGS